MVSLRGMYKEGVGGSCGHTGRSCCKSVLRVAKRQANICKVATKLGPKLDDQQQKGSRDVSRRRGRGRGRGGDSSRTWQPDTGRERFLLSSTIFVVTPAEFLPLYNTHTHTSTHTHTQHFVACCCCCCCWRWKNIIFINARSVWMRIWI